MINSLVILKLFEGGTFLKPDDIMGLSYSHLDGSFRVEGCGSDFGSWNSPDPYVKFFHYCLNPTGTEVKTSVQKIFNPQIINLDLIRLN